MLVLGRTSTYQCRTLYRYAGPLYVTAQALAMGLVRTYPPNVLSVTPDSIQAVAHSCCATVFVPDMAYVGLRQVGQEREGGGGEGRERKGEGEEGRGRGGEGEGGGERERQGQGERGRGRKTTLRLAGHPWGSTRRW